MATISSSPSNKNKEDVQSSDLAPTAPPATTASTAAPAPAASQSEPAPSEPKEKVTPDATPPKETTAETTDEATKSSEREKVWKARAKKTKKTLETISDVVGGIITFIGIILCISGNGY